MPGNQQLRPGVWGGVLGGPRDMAKLDWLNPSLQKVQRNARRKDA